MPSTTQDVTKNSLILTKHARERYYQRVISGKESKDRCEKLLKKSWDNAVFHHKQEDCYVWKVSNPYPCTFITKSENKDHVILTVLWPISNKSSESIVINHQLIQEESEYITFMDHVHELTNKKGNSQQVNESIKILKKIANIELQTIIIERKSNEDVINFETKIRFLEKSMRILRLALMGDVLKEKCIPYINACLNYDAESVYKHTPGQEVTPDEPDTDFELV